MRRAEIWWADMPAPAGRRPVVLLSRDEVYVFRELVTIAPVTTRIRNIPVEVALGKSEGLPKRCVANLDTITTIPKKCLVERIGPLPAEKVKELDNAIRLALGLDPISP
ncbi:MAG TPA: type II toxin-antitoxin system PemK/MazF family toxin [bacterium]|nr:type II toxin-antitoxin system PemK/MazF family toxin [bacterium]